MKKSLLWCSNYTMMSNVRGIRQRTLSEQNAKESLNGKDVGNAAESFQGQSQRSFPNTGRVRCISGGSGSNATIPLKLDEQSADGNAGKTRGFGNLVGKFASFFLNEHKDDSAMEITVDEMDVSDATPPVINFEALGILGGRAYIEHPDFDSDIVIYQFHTQAVTPSNVLSKWACYKSDGFYRSVVAVLYDIFLSQPLPIECLYLAVFYMNSFISVQQEALSSTDIELACIAAVNLASKVEIQCSLSLLQDVNKKEVFDIEKRILTALDFSVNPTTPISFMRLLKLPACGDNAQLWTLSKFLSQLALFNLELAMLPSSLMAAVVMRLVVYLNNEIWDSSLYSFMRSAEVLYERPEAILCRLLLISPNSEYGEIYSLYRRYFLLIDRVISNRKDWISKRAQTVSDIAI